MTGTGTEIKEQEREQLTPDKIYKNNIYALVDDVKELEQFKGLTDEELKENKSFFPMLVDYIYNNYVGDLLGNNKAGKVIYNNIDLLDNLFNIYTHLVYTYKWNNRPSLIEFSIFTGINQNTFYEWLKGNTTGLDNNINGQDKRRHITPQYCETVQKWQTVCERALVDGSDTIREIFLLKARHNYRDNNNTVEVNINHKNIISADELPNLIDLKPL